MFSIIIGVDVEKPDHQRSPESCSMRENWESVKRSAAIKQLKQDLESESGREMGAEYASEWEERRKRIESGKRLRQQQQEILFQAAIDEREWRRMRT